MVELGWLDLPQEERAEEEEVGAGVLEKMLKKKAEVQ